MAEYKTAFQALADLAQKSLMAAQQLPAQKDAVAQWSGVGFSMFGKHFVVSMDELNEMLEVPAHTKLPGVQPWVKGIANVRGRLLPIFDLAAFFGELLIGNKKQQRLLVIDRNKTYAGLWVDQVFGMQYFDISSRKTELSTELPESIEEFIDGSFELNGTTWSVFHPLKLMEKPNFMDVSGS
jgi:twitching motility protein PilI